MRETIRETIQETIQETIPETRRETISETILETIWETIRDTMRETIRETIQETIWETIRVDDPPKHAWGQVPVLGAPVPPVVVRLRVSHLYCIALCCVKTWATHTGLPL